MNFGFVFTCELLVVDVLGASQPSLLRVLNKAVGSYSF